MANYAVRVELHDANWEDYVALHKNMNAKGFSQKITAYNGQAYKLPPAEYTYSGGDTNEQVLAKAKAAAAQVKARYAVFVAQWTTCTWYGLEAA
jgi:hypothetical protein